MATDRKSRLQEFVDWAAAHITGDEKGQAQIFLDRLFRAFSREGVLGAGVQTESRVRKLKEDGGGVAFADCVWKPLVLIEILELAELGGLGASPLGDMIYSSILQGRT